METKKNGFSLIELMIAVVVVAILVAIAYPSYVSYVQKGNRPVAKTALLELASRQESYYALNNAYASQMTSLGYSQANMPIPSSTQNYYTLTVSSATTGNPPGYTLQATPVTGSVQATDACQTYQLDSLGNKSNLNASGASLTVSGCW